VTQTFVADFTITNSPIIVSTDSTSTIVTSNTVYVTVTDTATTTDTSTSTPAAKTVTAHITVTKTVRSRKLEFTEIRQKQPRQRSKLLPLRKHIPKRYIKPSLSPTRNRAFPSGSRPSLRFIHETHISLTSSRLVV
jgi:hypothetical protein